MDFLSRAETFLRVADAGSLSAAARALRTSLPVVSRRLSSLERELAATLLVRTTRRIQLTEAGRRFREHALRLVREAAEARASVDPRAELAGRTVLSTSVTLGTLRVLPGLAPFVAAHPKIDLEVRLEDRVADLVGEGIDVALRAGIALPDSSSVIAQPIASFRQVLVASPAYLKRAPAPRAVEDLARHAAVRGPSAPSTWRFEADGGAQVVSVATRLRVGTLLGIATAAEAGIGLAVLPDFVVAGALAARRLRAVDVGASLPDVVVHALYRVELRGSARIDALVRHLRGTVPLTAPLAPPHTRVTSSGTSSGRRPRSTPESPRDRPRQSASR